MTSDLAGALLSIAAPDELLEDLVHQRAPAERVDLKASFGFLDVFDAEQIAEQVAPRAGCPGFQPRR